LKAFQQSFFTALARKMADDPLCKTYQQRTKIKKKPAPTVDREDRLDNCGFKKTGENTFPPIFLKATVTPNF
jgi:hypothetical protein